MISHADVEKLRSIRAPGPTVLSLYLPVPMDPVGVPGLTAQAEDLMAGAGAGRPDGVSIAKVGQADRAAVLGALAAHGRDWLGHTVAFFACQQLALFETLPLPCVLPGRAVLATRPHVRPLLAAKQRCPDYLVAIISRRHAWVLSVSGNRAETVNEGAVAELLVAHEGMIAGYVCGCCGALSTGSDECAHWGTAARAVPDLLEEMTQRTLNDNGPVTMIRDAPFSVAATLRFPVTGR